MYIINVYRTFVNTNSITAMQPNNEYYDSLVCETNERFNSIDHDFDLALEKSNHLYNLLISSSDDLTKLPFYLKDLSDKILEISVKASSFREPEKLKISLKFYSEIFEYLVKFTTSLPKLLEAIKIFENSDETEILKYLGATEFSKNLDTTEIFKLIENDNRLKFFKIIIEIFDINRLESFMNRPPPKNNLPLPEYLPLRECISAGHHKFVEKSFRLLSVFEDILTQILNFEEVKQPEDEEETEKSAKEQLDERLED